MRTTCGTCHGPVDLDNSQMLSDGNHLCDICGNEPPACHHCGVELPLPISRYHSDILPGGFLCYDCNDADQHLDEGNEKYCDQCNLPLGEYVDGEHKRNWGAMCGSCYEACHGGSVTDSEVKECAACGMKVPQFGDQYRGKDGSLLCFGCHGDIWNVGHPAPAEVVEFVMKFRNGKSIVFPPPDPPANGLFLYHKECTEKMLEIIISKNTDYAGNGRELKNFELCEDIGVCDVKTGILVRILDKVARLTTVLGNGECKVPDETVEDTLLDMANYLIILGYHLKTKKD